MFGKKVSEKEIQEFRKSGERGIIVFDEKYITLIHNSIITRVSLFM